MPFLLFKGGIFAEFIIKTLIFWKIKKIKQNLPLNKLGGLSNKLSHIFDIFLTFSAL